MTTSAIHNQYWLLDNVVGWRGSITLPLTLTQPDGALALEPLPGTAQLLKGAVENKLVCPAALAPDGCGRAVVVDARKDRVGIVNLATGAVETLWSFGGPGRLARQFQAPRGVALLPHGAVAVSDTGNNRLQIFSAAPYALLQLWGRAEGKSGTGKKEFHWPWGIVSDPCGVLYIVDRGNHRIQKINKDGTWLDDIGSDVLKDPTEIALGPAGVLAVVDQKAAAVVLLPAGGVAPTTIAADAPTSVAFDDAGNLFVGNAKGLIYKLAPDPQKPGAYQTLGVGVTGVEGPVVNLVWTKRLGNPTQNKPGLVGIFGETANKDRQRIWKIDPAGASALQGVFGTGALDSKIEHCVWHRVQLLATVPANTSVLVETLTSERPLSATEVAAFAGSSRALLGGSDDPDCLVLSPPGRYLWLRLTVRSSGLASPQIRAIKVYFPRDSYLHYLPAVYQEDPESRAFLERFLSIFQSSLDAFDRRIDQVWELFDPLSVPAKYFLWLAAWLALPVDPTWSMEKKRQMLKKAFREYLRRGTPAGIEQAIEDYAGVQARIVEHFRLRHWSTLTTGAVLDGGVRLWSRDFYRRLQLTSFSRVGSFRLTGRGEPLRDPLDWGAHAFSVFFHADPYRSAVVTTRVQRVVDREKPVHTLAELCPIYPRMRVGVQATVGVDSVVGGITHLVLNSLATLGYDSILACSAPEHNVRLQRSSVRPRVGVNATIL